MTAEEKGRDRRAQGGSHYLSSQIRGGRADCLAGLPDRAGQPALDGRRRCRAQDQAGAPLCLAIIDINGFKPIRDEHGHLAGDEVLKQFSAELQSVCRSAT